MAATYRLLVISAIFCLLAGASHGQLSTTFYANTCSNLESIVQSAMVQAVNREPRMAASVLRLFFHDCFVNGCDASILLADTATFTGEQQSNANKNSARGYQVIDAIKTKVEAACKATVSCADILALAAREGVVKLGGPTWTVQLGRRDATTASLSDANSNLPPPFDSLANLTKLFASKNLSPRDMTALSGGHTIGQARCTSFRAHLNETDIDATFSTSLQKNCPLSGGGDNNLAPLDLQTPNSFGNNYYQNLVAKKGLLHSDQELFNGGTQDSLVKQYSVNSAAFTADFAAAMVKMGGISPLTGSSGEVRLSCGKVN